MITTASQPLTTISISTMQKPLFTATAAIYDDIAQVVSFGSWLWDDGSVLCFDDGSVVIYQNTN